MEQAAKGAEDRTRYAISKHPAQNESKSRGYPQLLSDSLCLSFQQDHSVGGHAGAVPGETQALLCGGLYVHLVRADT